MEVGQHWVPEGIFANATDCESGAVAIEIDKGRTQEAVLAEFNVLFVGDDYKGLEFLRKLVSHMLLLRVAWLKGWHSWYQ
jgi:hypothetical protein